ncbi:MAG: ATP-binding protein [Saprospiraceae bacterium]|nr:ATP-binding protein [Saprospiraceae bacterium]
MSKIRIKNFGPIKEGYLSENEDGWLDIKKVTVFIGNQGSGKSTVAKLISMFTWIEMSLVRGDSKAEQWEIRHLETPYLAYHRLDKYFDKEDENRTFVDYWGDAYRIILENSRLKITENNPNGYLLPKIMYVPAERNFLAHVKDSGAIDFTSQALKDFALEYRNALNHMIDPLQLPINNVEVKYNKLDERLYLIGKDYRLDISKASSGFQSLVPMYLVSRHLANSIKAQSAKQSSLTGDEMERFKQGVSSIWENESLTEEQRRIALSALASKFNKSAFINIVEEPEQNLFPTSQWEILKSLLEFNNMNKGNKLIMTTHSPYLINYLTLAVKAKMVNDKIQQSSNNKDELKSKLSEIVPIQSIVNSDDLVIYELNEADGTIIKLDDYRGLPSDENYLNQRLAEGNELFAQLLEIEDLCL